MTLTIGLVRREVPAGRTVAPVRLDSALRRGVDVLVAVIGLVVAAPVLAALAVAVKLTSRGPALFRQPRVGRDGQPFTIVKLRTMRIDRAGGGALVSGSADPRVTRFGSWLRPTRLDELPQLVNLLRGEVTLIGSRPEVERFIPYYTPEEREILRTRPGIVGAGAILFASGQCDELNSVADPEAYYVEHHLHPRLALDLDYLSHRSLRRDVVLMARALGVCARRG
jgi:lipopolysaccharide/colanic/teichoic acid biosynthesis glycosyltransferase